MSSAATMVLMPEVVRTVNSAAYIAWPALRPFGFQPADVRQELLVHILERATDYDERRSSLPTFTSHLCKSRTLHILERGYALKRNAGIVPLSLSEPANLAEVGETAKLESGNAISEDAYAVRTGRRSRSTAELLMLSFDVARVVRRLPAELSEVARLLAAGEPMIAVTRQLKISRSTLHRRIVRLRQVFRAAGLDQYTRLREAA